MHAYRQEQLLQTAGVLQHAPQLREFYLSIGTKMNFISPLTGDREETLKKRYAKYLEKIDPQRKWIKTISGKVKNRKPPSPKALQQK
jgi:hypothetical protein